jgi:hypothetical protein
VEQFKADVVASLEELGWVIEGTDDLTGLDFKDLLSA